MFHVTTRETTAKTVASIEKHVYVAQLPDLIEREMAKIYAQLTAAELEIGIPFVVYQGQVNDDSDGPVEICVPYAGSFDGTAGVTSRVEQGGTEAFTTITKAQLDFPGILEAYDAVAEWVESSDFELAGDPREVYYSDPSAADPDESVADIAWPVR
jgi:effector-binding domain-containing protein